MDNGNVRSGGGMRDKRFEVENDAVKATLNQIAGKVGGALDRGWGFLLMLFEFGAGGSMFYISSAERGDVMKMTQEWIDKQRAEQGLAASELNPGHPVTRSLHDHWHKVSALLLLRATGGDRAAEVTFTQADMDAFVALGNVAIGVRDDAAGMTLFMTTEDEALRMMQEGKAQLEPPVSAQERRDVTGS